MVPELRFLSKALIYNSSSSVKPETQGSDRDSDGGWVPIDHVHVAVATSLIGLLITILRKHIARARLRRLLRPSATTPAAGLWLPEPSRVSPAVVGAGEEIPWPAQIPGVSAGSVNDREVALGTGHRGCKNGQVGGVSGLKTARRTS